MVDIPQIEVENILHTPIIQISYNVQNIDIFAGYKAICLVNIRDAVYCWFSTVMEMNGKNEEDMMNLEKALE